MIKSSNFSLQSTVINTSKEMTAYSDFPPPAEAANYMHNR
jgi:dimethylaniline monooxygenase (N-oxide forming)